MNEIPKINCICCDSTQHRLKGRKLGYSIYRCNTCGYEFVYPMPGNKELEKVYNTGMHRDLESRVKDEIKSLNEDKNHPHRDWYYNILEKAKLVSGKQQLRILEVGSSFGGFIHYANNEGHHAVGTEISQEVASASKGLINGQVLYSEHKDYTLLFERGSFDLVYMEHVLEHLTHPEEIVPQLSTLLRDNGVMVIGVPNQKSWMAQLYGIYWDWTSPPLHLHYFNKDNLQLLFQKSGLNKRLWWTGEYYYRSIYQFFTVSKLIYRFRQIIHKLSGLGKNPEYMTSYLYKYPSNLRNIFSLLPYYIMFPVIKLFALSGKGNDLTVFFVKEKGKITSK